MATRKPLVRGTGEELLEELQSGDTLSTEDISDSLDKRFVSDAEKAMIYSSGGGYFIISDSQPSPAPGVKVVWLQTNVGGNPNDTSLWLVTGE